MGGERHSTGGQGKRTAAHAARAARAARWSASGILVASLLSLGAVQCAGGATPQPAYYTWQAPGGASTAGRRVVALTFDDGPGPYTPEILSVLAQYHVPATFFEVGQDVAEYPAYTRMVAAAGDAVEDHTWSHPDLTQLTAAQVDAQIEQTQQEIHSVIGRTPDCLRPPYDAWNPTVLDRVSAKSLTTMSYSVDPRDWSLPGVTAIVRAVVDGAFPGAVVDLHDGGATRAQTVAALPAIVTSLHARGYAFVSVCGYATVPTASDTSAVDAFGDAPSPGTPIPSVTPYVGAAGTASGYWLTARDGGVFSSSVPFYGSMGGAHLAAPVVGMAATRDGRGYWLVASDGGIFSFGDARFAGSMGGAHLAAPVVGMAADVATGGYWEVAADGGVFSFAAPFYGSMGRRTPATRYFAMVATPGGTGYLLAGASAATSG